MSKRTLFLMLCLFVAVSAFGQMQIKVNDNVNLKFGLLLQSQGDALQDAATLKYAQNVFIRRARILLGGQIAPGLTFFAETDSPNIGKSLTTGTKNTNVSMFLQDAYFDYKFSDQAILEAGLMLVSPSRNGLQSAASLMPIDYGAHTFANSAPTQSAAGRDTGFQMRGYFLKNKLEYRAGVFQGMRDTQDRELRTTFRVQYNVFDPETSYFYTGTYLGKKKILAIGGGLDRQHKYDAYAFDVFFDQPVSGGAFTLQFDHFKYNGKDYLKSLADQNDNLLEAGFLIGKTKFMPVVQFAKRDLVGKTVGDETRYGGGLNYFLVGHNANLKALYTTIKSRGINTTKQFTVQLQFFYF